MQFSKEEKAMWLEDWKSSGKAAWTYAKTNGLNPQTFKRWTKLESESKNNFVEIPAKIISSVQGTLGIVIEKADIRIHIPLGLSGVELHTVMEGLKAVL